MTARSANLDTGPIYTNQGATNMGDKGGKKDKAKAQKQAQAKQAQKAKKKEEAAPKKRP